MCVCLCKWSTNWSTLSFTVFIQFSAQPCIAIDDAHFFFLRCSLWLLSLLFYSFILQLIFSCLLIWLKEKQREKESNKIYSSWSAGAIAADEFALVQNKRAIGTVKAVHFNLLFCTATASCISLQLELSWAPELLLINSSRSRRCRLFRFLLWRPSRKQLLMSDAAAAAAAVLVDVLMMQTARRRWSCSFSFPLVHSDWLAHFERQIEFQPYSIELHCWRKKREREWGIHSFPSFSFFFSFKVEPVSSSSSSIHCAATLTFDLKFADVVLSCRCCSFLSCHSLADSYKLNWKFALSLSLSLSGQPEFKLTTLALATISTTTTELDWLRNGLSMRN